MKALKVFFIVPLVVIFLGTLVLAEAAKININTATVEQLAELPGVGEATAKKIIEYREQNGNFKTAQDIMNVKGIGEKKYEKLEDLITVSN